MFLNVRERGQGVYMSQDNWASDSALVVPVFSAYFTVIIISYLRNI
jgi:hypothetical protein